MHLRAHCETSRGVRVTVLSYNMRQWQMAQKTSVIAMLKSKGWRFKRFTWANDDPKRACQGYV